MWTHFETFCMLLDKISSLYTAKYWPPGHTVCEAHDEVNDKSMIKELVDYIRKWSVEYIRKLLVHDIRKCLVDDIKRFLVDDIKRCLVDEFIGRRVFWLPKFSFEHEIEKEMTLNRKTKMTTNNFIFYLSFFIPCNRKTCFFWLLPNRYAELIWHNNILLLLLFVQRMKPLWGSTYHPVALGSNPEQNMYAFWIHKMLLLECEKNETKQNSQQGPMLKRDKPLIVKGRWISSVV